MKIQIFIFVFVLFQNWANAEGVSFDSTALFLQQLESSGQISKGEIGKFSHPAVRILTSNMSKQKKQVYLAQLVDDIEKNYPMLKHSDFFQSVRKLSIQSIGRIEEKDLLKTAKQLDAIAGGKYE